MSAANLDVFRNGIFLFEVVGGKLAAHKNLVARTSDTLRAMMENGMQESQKGCATLPDISEATFARFLEFVYTGDYNAAEPGKPPRVEISNRHSPVLKETYDDLPLIGAEANPEDDLWVVRSKKSKQKGNKTARGGKGSPLNEFDWPVEIENATKESRPMPQTPSLQFDLSIIAPLPTDSKFPINTDLNLDYLPLFLSHAELYVFADKYNVPKLQHLAAGRLHDAITRFQYQKSGRTDIAELVEYVYTHTADREEEIDVLRAIVATFCARHIRALHTSEAMRRLVHGGGSFALDLVSQMTNVFGFG